PVLSSRAMPDLDRVLFFGTPEFAVPTLAALVAAGRVPVRVVTQPARPAGRGQKSMDPPVARWAREQGLPVSQPERVREPAFLEELASLTPDLAIVVAFGQIFPRALLDLPRLGCVNLHASLLPRWRGAAPIQAAIAAGDETTGVTTMQMEAGLDSGPILLQEEEAIGPRETAGDLAARLAGRGASLVVRTLAALEAGTVVPRPQPEEGVTYAPRLSRDSGRIDWSLSARQIADRLRAFTPWPGCATTWRAAPLKIVAAEPLDRSISSLASTSSTSSISSSPALPGTVLGQSDGLLTVACGGGTVLGIRQLQKAGKLVVDAPAFVNGERLQPGERFA